MSVVSISVPKVVSVDIANLKLEVNRNFNLIQEIET